MKRIKTCFYLLVGFLTASCNALDLGPEDHYSINNYWNSPEQCERFMIGLHFRLRERAEQLLVMGELRGGMLNTSSVTSTGEGAYYIEAVNNNLSEANPGLKNWGNFYMDIYQINHAIDKMTNACAFLDDRTRCTYLGQLYGLRAFYYFHMLRTWGGVPLCDKPDVLMTGEIAKLSKERATEQQTWQFVRDDVERSCRMYESLGFEQFKNKNCYWNKAASYCLKAEVCLWGAQVKPLKGSAVLSPAPEEELAAARDALLAVEPLYSPNPRFADAFSPTNKDANRETIFALRFKLGEKTNYYQNFTYNVATITKYLDRDGNKLGNVFNIGSGAMRFEYSQACYDNFDADDARREATFMQFYLKDNDENIYPAGRALCKFLGEVDNGKTQFTNDVPIYRYTDVALMLAEVNNCLNVPAGVKRWIEAVRTRAYGAMKMPAFTYTTEESAGEAILAERTREFIAEGKRWYDVRRLLGGRHALELVRGDELKLVWPIDAGVLSKDSKVQQNEGYVTQ